MKVLLAPDPVLRQVCEPIDRITSSLRRTCKQMAKIMYKDNGCGLAAPQVGILKRFIVIDCDLDANTEKPQFLFNPEIIEHSDEMVANDEGCLSVPGITLQVPRYTYVKVRAMDVDEEEIVIEAEDDLLCRCLQHEIDHLDGLTMFERISPIDRLSALQEYKAALAAGAKPGDMRY